MYIKSIILDGFKSYARRTEINGFDREFNAITGLNGSGKSNILDAICFLLGLTNLGQVRAQMLQDLVYKMGQSGITKATVTIVFDNSNKRQTPVGYESYDEITVTRQVVMGGKNKYLINGVNAPNSRVKDLFCSVQLNVNNPHFLVMQGRITKVLSMKPTEILSMIEEAAGTRMFESKKQQAEKTLFKKDSKLLEIDAIINEEINPKLAKLREERGQYLEFKKVERELEHLQKLYIAWKYVSSKELCEQANSRSVEIKQSISNKKQAIKDGEVSIHEISKRIDELQKLRDDENGGRLAQAEFEVREREKIVAKHVGIEKQKNETIQDYNKSIKQLEKGIRDDEKVLKTKTESLSNINSVFQRLAEEEQRDKADLERAQNRFQALSSGLVADDAGGEATLQDQLIAAERSIAQAKTEFEQGKLQNEHCKADLNRKKSEMQKTETDFKKDSRTLKVLEEEVNNLNEQLVGLNHNEGGLEELQNEYRQLKHEARILRGRAEAFESREGRLTFRYQDPEANFDRSSVHGLVCKLINIVDPQFAIALEKAAGGRLYNVVTDNEVTSRKLLNKGHLERRTTIIPLNKIIGRKIDQRTHYVAEKLAGRGNVWPALSLIEYDPVLEPAMQYIFGTTFVCKDLNVAKKVCYHPEVMKKCVTLDGDVCDPSGTLSGGARQQIEPVLLKIRDMKKVQEELNVKENRITELEHQIRNLSANEERYTSIKQRYDLKNHELGMVRQRLQQTTHYQYQEEVKQIEAKIAQISEKQRECKEIIDRESKKVTNIKNKMKNAKANRERELKLAENEVKELKKKAELSRLEREKRTEEYDSLRLELEDLRKSIENNKTQIEKNRHEISKLEEEKVSVQAELNEAKELLRSLQADYKAIKDTITQKTKEIAQAAQQKDNIIKESREFELQIKELEQEYEKSQKDAKDNKRRVADMLKEYDWIPQEEKYFGLPNGIYDFKENNPHDAAKRITMLQELKDKLSKTVNIKSMSLLTKTEEQYTDLMKRRQQVEIDKNTILAVIDDLDQKKKDALKMAWIQVNKDFGSIFSSLLPGAVAKLEPPEGLTVLDGLEFRVGFGGKWKESLGELSGGQRSLVALSLILAMLLFKPAPIYILDEVDAALDLSHTQNIGNMLKTHFKSSQFIVVSLKDGMFNNANVLFRTKFVDGMSTISRTLQNQSKHRGG